MGSPREISGPLYGYRAWRLRDHNLYSFSGWRAWPSDSPKVALCWRNLVPLGNTHVAPGSGCNCGIYAWADLPSSSYSPQGLTPIWGVVELSGHVIRHQRGYRAQFAWPVAIVLAEGIEKVVERYRLKVLSALTEWPPW